MALKRSGRCGVAFNRRLCQLCLCPATFFNSLLTPCFVQLFSGNSSVNLFVVYLFKSKLFYQNVVLVAEYHVVC